MVEIETILLTAAVLLLLSIVASKASARLGIPALLLFLLIGMLAGSEGLGDIYFDDPRLAQSLGVVALSFILFSGGVDTRWSRVRPALQSALILSTLGVFITALLIGGFAALLLGFSLYEGLLLGAIVSSTDAAATFAVLRSRSVALRGQIEPLLELESGSNDPMAVFLTIGVISLLINPAASIASLIPMFLLQMTLGVIFGFGIGKIATFVINHIRLEYDGLYPVLTLSLVLLTYGVTEFVGGNGFLAVYITGLVLGNSDFIHRRSLMRFHDGLAWLMQITMFLVLGLLVFPSRLAPVIGVGLLVSVILMFVARPVSVQLLLIFSKMNFREKLMVSWVGLRGAVPIILATFPLLAGVPKADEIFNLVFFVVLTSVLLQGTSLPKVASWLGVDESAPAKPRSPLELEDTGSLKSELVEIEVPANSAIIGKQLVHLSFPPDTLIVLIGRGNDFVIPRGGTIFQPGDRLLALADKKAISQVRMMIEEKKPNAEGG